MIEFQSILNWQLDSQSKEAGSSYVGFALALKYTRMQLQLVKIAMLTWIILLLFERQWFFFHKTSTVVIYFLKTSFEDGKDSNIQWLW